MKEFRNSCGGNAIEKAASKGDPRAIDLGSFMTSYKDCNFSYSGLKNAINTQILKLEKKHGIYIYISYILLLLFDIIKLGLITFTFRIKRRRNYS